MYKHKFLIERFIATKNLHKGFGFVEFELPEDAEAAIDNMHLAELNGKVIKVQLAKPSNITATSHRAGISTNASRAFIPLLTVLFI